MTVSLLCECDDWLNMSFGFSQNTLYPMPNAKHIFKRHVDARKLENMADNLSAMFYIKIFLSSSLRTMDSKLIGQDILNEYKGQKPA